MPIAENFGFFLYIIVILLGLALGSFLNSWIWRTRENLGYISSRSICVHCRRQLKWFENIPLVSFLFLRGRCRTCKKQIPPRYFLIELAGAVLLFIITWLHTHTVVQSEWHYFRDVVFTLILLTVFVYDALYTEVLSGLIWAGAVFGLLINKFILHYTWPSLIIGMIIGGGFFLAQYVISRGRWIGGGDVRIGVMIGLWLGFPAIITALFIAYVTGAFISVSLVVLKLQKKAREIPFGPYLAAGTLITLLFNQEIINWYLHLFR